MAFHKRALFSDMTENYLSPAEPEENSSVTVKFRTGKNNVDRVVIAYNGNKYVMKWAYSDELFDYYQYVIHVDHIKISYHFEIYAEDQVYFYDRRGISDTNKHHFNFDIIPGFRTPEWAKGVVMYQIFVDRFCNGDPDNDVVDQEYVYLQDYVKKVPDWYQTPQADDTKEFYGGDLQGVIDKLGYLKDLGIEAIYFNPLFVSPSNHKYDAQDYEHIDPHFGKIVKDNDGILRHGVMSNMDAEKYICRTTQQENLDASDMLFAQLVSKAHQLGIKVILDGVFNHCGSFHKWLDKEGIYKSSEQTYEAGAYWDENSEYHDFFRFQDDAEWPDHVTYEAWWGFDTLPKLNYDDSDALYAKIMAVGKKWVSPPFNADGWRLDVAADLGHGPELNHRFFRDFRKTVKEANPDAIILAEHYGSARNWLQGDEWDSVMNYDGFMEPLTWFLTGMEKHSDSFRQDMYNNTNVFWSSMITGLSCFSGNALQVAMNELSNHDHSRFLTRTSHKIGRIEYLPPQAAEEGVDKAVMREAVIVQMTWPGAPTIYYGDEAGVCGFTDPDNRRTYPWGREDQEMLSFHKEMIRIHKENKEFRTGSLKRIISLPGVLGYGRFTNEEQSLVIVNNGDTKETMQVLVWELGVPKETVMDRLMLSTGDSFTTEPAQYQVLNGRVEITLAPKSGIILKHCMEQVKNQNSKFFAFIQNFRN